MTYIKIDTYIDGSPWEIEMKRDYKHKSGFISWEQFAGPLLQFKEHIFPDHIFDTMKNLKPGFGITTNCDIDIETGDLVLPKDLILRLTQIFNADPHFPVDIKLLNMKTNQKYHVHFRKDGSSSIRWTYKASQNNSSDPTPTNPCPTHDRHWL